MADETRRSSGHSEYGAAPRSASYGTHNDISQNGDSARIDFTQIVKDTLRAFISNWWLFILIAAVLCAFLCIRAKRSYYPIYKAKATFTVNVVGITGANGAYYSQGTAEQLSRTFPAILRSGILGTLVCEDLGVKSLPASINAYVEGSTALFTIETTSGDPDSAYKVLKSVIKVYPDVALFVVGNTSLNLISEPQLPTEPINTIAYASCIKTGLLTALAVCLILALFLALTRKTIRNTNDLRPVFSLRCIGSIPFERAVKHGRRREFTSIENENTSKNFIDAVRLIRTRIEKSMKENNEQVVLVASSVPGEGKTTVSVNIALALAEKGRRVILVDCDIRKPSVIGGYSGLCEKGLVDYLLGDAGIDDIIGTKNEYLDVINGVRNSNNAAELLRTRRMHILIHELRKRYEYVVLDSPPCAIMADAQALTNIADCAVYVVCQEYTRKNQIIDGMNNLANINVRYIGYVLNNASSSGMGSAYGKYGGAYGKYGGQYGKYGAYSKVRN